MEGDRGPKKAEKGHAHGLENLPLMSEFRP